VKVIICLFLGSIVQQRKWGELVKGNQVEVSPYSFNPNNQYVAKITFRVDFFQRNNSTSEPYDTDMMAKEITMQFGNQAFSKGQGIAFRVGDKKLLLCVVKEIESVSLEAIKAQTNAPSTMLIDCGLLLPNSTVMFEKEDMSAINLTGKSVGRQAPPSLINPNWDFENLGIGGLDDEFNAIFRRAFASRVFPVDVIEQLGIKHVRGILLYGPPGTGKTLMARQIGKMLNAREPKIVNGPQILDKYVGESEANIRRLFEDAEVEFKRVGNNSGLHIIIFDEIDAICKARGSVAGNSGVHDTVVNQLLSKMDGVESLNNILVIGMTNRRDMIDEALLRPGRMEVQLEISLPDEHGRLQILNIHTSLLRTHGKLNTDVVLDEVAKLTKNFSGAELEGLVRAAQSTAMNRLVKASNKVEVDPDALVKLTVTRNDFLHALANDVKPAFGTSQEEIEQAMGTGIIEWGQPVVDLLEDGQFLIRQAQDERSYGLVTVLLEGAPKTGKTSLAAKLALSSGFPFVKMFSPDSMVGYTETAKCHALRKVFDDAYKSPLACVIVDNLERLLDYAAIGPRYSNLVLQALLVLLNKQPPKGRKLLVLCTTSRREVLDELELSSAFTSRLHCAHLSRPEHILAVLNAFADERDPSLFSREERTRIGNQLVGWKLYIGIKRLLNYIDMARQVSTTNSVCFLTIHFNWR
jgi:vesicle-fusing ATPase